MGKFREMLVVYSDSENSCDSLELIDPVNNLSLEHIEKKKSSQDYEDQSNQLEKLHLNDSNEIIQKRNKITNQYRHHPYSQPKKSKSKTKIQNNNKRDQCDMKFLKSLGYIEYSKCKNTRISNDKVDTIEQLFTQINQSIKSTFSKYLKSNDQPKQNVYVCNRRSN